MFFEQVVYGMTLGGVYALAALGFTLIFGVLRLLHVAHGDVMIFAGYVALAIFMLMPGMPLAILLVVGMLVAGILGVVVERIAFRPYAAAHPIMPLIAGIGLILVLQNTEILVWGPQQMTFETGWDPGIVSLGSLQIPQLRLAILFLSVLVMLVLNLFLFRTRTGLAIRATAIDSEVASLMGMNPQRIIVFAFVIGSALGGAGSVLIGSLYGTIYPSLGFSLGVKAFIASIVGGLGNLSGALAGGLMLGMLEVFTTGYIGVAYRDGVSMALLLLVLIFRPNGIMGRQVEEKV